MRVSKRQICQRYDEEPERDDKKHRNPVFVRDLQEGTYESDDYQQRSSDCGKALKRKPSHSGAQHDASAAERPP